MNRSVKLLEVNVCHLTQFAFFWSFYAKHGLILFDKTHSSKYIRTVKECTRTLLTFLGTISFKRGDTGLMTVFETVLMFGRSEQLRKSSRFEGEKMYLFGQGTS